MRKKKKIEKLLNTEGHLTGEGIALWVDALLIGKEKYLPLKMKKHVEGCFVCKSKIVELHTLLHDKIEFPDEHPYFGKTNKKQGRQIFVGKNRFRFAAALVLLIAFSVLLFHLFQKKPDENLFTEYFSPYPNIVAERSDVSINNKQVEAAFYFYDNMHYSKAVFDFKKIMDSGTLSDTLLFYYGNSLLASGNSTEAVSVFLPLSKNIKSVFASCSKWYLALAYLSKGDKKLTINMLNEIINSESPYSSKAKKLLSAL